MLIFLHSLPALAPAIYAQEVELLMHAVRNFIDLNVVVKNRLNKFKHK